MVRTRIVWLSALLVLAPAAALAQAPTEAELTKVIGTKRDGWVPSLVSKLKGKMTPADAAKVFPGADKVSQFGFAKVEVKDAPGVREVELYFAKDKATGQPTELQSVKIVWDPKLTPMQGFFDSLLKVCEAKYGKAKPESVQKRIITWVGKGFKTAQLTEFPDRAGKVMQLKVTL